METGFAVVYARNGVVVVDSQRSQSLREAHAHAVALGLWEQTYANTAYVGYKQNGHKRFVACKDGVCQDWHIDWIGR